MFAVAAAGMAQTPTATLVGRITDSSGAPIPGASIQARHL
jgi:hypothetical protein